MIKEYIRSLFSKIKELFFETDINFVGGGENLPEPLTKEREEEYLKRISDGDESAREPLIVHNLRLVVYIAKKFDSSGVGTDDLVSIGTIGLIKAVNTFKPEKNIKLAPTLQGVLKMKF